MRLLNLAPHCQIPPMTGADHRAWHLHQNMIAAGIDGHFIGRQSSGRDGGKALTALSALLAGHDYWQHKMLTPQFRHAVAQFRIKEYEAMVIHFLYSVPLISAWRGKQLRLLVETHNSALRFPAAVDHVGYRILAGLFVSLDPHNRYNLPLHRS
jgi:hypothetical protein